MRAYKFYSKRWGLEALYRRRLKITTADELNDPFEFGAVSSQIPRIRQAFSNWKKEMFSDKGLICFSKGWKNPVIWSHYAQSHTGIALGFDLHEKIALDVQYVRKRLELPRELQNGVKSFSDLNYGRKIVTTKFHHWAYENEVRVFSPLSEDHFENGFYFEPFGAQITLREVIFGANYQSDLNSRLHKDLLREGVKFTTSRLAFKYFSIVVQGAKNQRKSL
jgi:hypothetical protein